MTAVTKSGKTRRSPSGAGAVLLAAAGLAGSFGVAACCALPFLLAGVGIETAWLEGIALVAAPHRTFLLAASAICLIGGAVLLWRQRARAACAPASICARPAMRGLTLVGLLVGLVFLYLGYAYV
jgi:mercuric ion transport protein